MIGPLRTTLLILAAAITPTLASAQTSAPPAKLPAYDIVSIKVNNQDTESWNMNTGHNTFTAREVPLKTLIAAVWHIREDLITGLSGPVTNLRFDIEAKLLDRSLEPTDKQLLLMMQPILIDRFHLKLHTQLKTLPAYELTVARTGLKLKPLPHQDNLTGGLNINNTNTYSQLAGKGITLDYLADALSDQLQRTVLDKTGLTEAYDFQLRWASNTPDVASDATLPTIFAALEEQLGLHLQPTKDPVPTLVIDHAEPPSQN